MWPEEIRLSKNKATLSLKFNTGEAYELSAEFLRVVSPSAEVQGHSADQRQIVPNKKSVLIADLQPVGNYALRIIFDDGHDSGLYSWDYLREIGADFSQLWQTYLDELAEKGLVRG